ncbi:hypothetical protein [Caldisalinibacter kiritimatiensis]|uniref:Alpha-glucosidase n=1 Tax=Caldisalinibacter kiritimatiensis TaxID=1304284 RepID=R1CVA6_9FIRM|nr:hypothetical protein [Caldisalinibacter kiritimatiensis]EOD00569.1 hypothetical protein L21TH_1387 [Caldisalinibacter kiritimatiensis]
MNTTELISILEEITSKVQKTKLLTQKKKDSYFKELQSLKEEYKTIEITEELNKVYKSLVKKGKELQKEFKAKANPKELNGKIAYYIKYLKAAKGDFTGITNYINKYFRIYLFTSILFLALSPQYFGFILPAIFFVPIFLGIRGLKNRSQTGFLLSLAVIPVALMTSFVWIRYGIYAISNYQKAVADTISSSGVSPILAKMLVIVPPILSVILTVLAIVQAYRAYKTKDLFV